LREKIHNNLRFYNYIPEAEELEVRYWVKPGDEAATEEELETAYWRWLDSIFPRKQAIMDSTGEYITERSFSAIKGNQYYFKVNIYYD